MRVAILIPDKAHLRAKRKENFLNVLKNTKLFLYKKVIKKYIAKKFKGKVLRKCVSQLINKNDIFGGGGSS